MEGNVLFAFWRPRRCGTAPRSSAQAPDERLAEIRPGSYRQFHRRKFQKRADRFQPQHARKDSKQCHAIHEAQLKLKTHRGAEEALQDHATARFCACIPASATAGTAPKRMRKPQEVTLVTRADWPRPGRCFRTAFEILIFVGWSCSTCCKDAELRFAITCQQCSRVPPPFRSLRRAHTYGHLQVAKPQGKLQHLGNKPLRATHFRVLRNPFVSPEN